MSPHRNARYATACISFLITLILERILKIRFVYEVIPLLWQYLDVEILKNDLLRGVFFLHSQPPLFNLYLGMILKVAGIHTPVVLAIVNQFCVFGILLGVTRLMEVLKIRLTISIFIVLLLALLPAILVYAN